MGFPILGGGTLHSTFAITCEEGSILLGCIVILKFGDGGDTVFSGAFWTKIILKKTMYILLCEHTEKYRKICKRIEC